MDGSAGMTRMKNLMQNLPHVAAQVARRHRRQAIRDYQNLTTTPLGGSPQPLDAPRGDMVILDLAEAGHYIAVRPSGTEPKVKFYLFTYVPAEQLHLHRRRQDEMHPRLANIEADLRDLSIESPETCLCKRR